MRQERVTLIGTQFREIHQGQRSIAPHQKAGHMTAPDRGQTISRKHLQCRGRPHM